MSAKRVLRIGTRGSVLALWQAEWVRSQLLTSHKGLSVELVTIKTTGDKILDVPLARVGGKGLFVKEIEDALLEDRADLAVHSVKDMPAELPEGLHLAVMPPREDARDVLVSRNHIELAQLEHGARVGTSSLRRASQLLHLRPDLRIEILRGNVDTRLRKLKSEGFDAIVLAAAGLKRMDLEHVISQYLPPDKMLPAVGQGALGIETRTEDGFTNQMVANLGHQPTMITVSSERAYLRRLEGGCQVPIGAHAAIDGEGLIITGMVADLNGKRMIRKTLRGGLLEAELLGDRLAEAVLESGGAEILAEIYDEQ
ncbi:MAG: hydroxymethylbilane synthase [Deltaproteobacteria bacterium]|nr:MAG: hydroxymethylbilane synthase [Deltaproteobacteria bacterium]